MYIKNKEIARLLEEICFELGRQDFLVNPYFRISKGEPEQIRKYKILNLMGKEIESGTIESLVHKINLRQYSQGIYLIYIEGLESSVKISKN